MSWPRAELKEEARVITKGTTPTTLGYSFTKTGVPFIRAQNLVDGTVSVSADPLFVSDETHQALKRSKIYPKDVLISIAGTIGRTAIVPDDAEEMNCNQAVAIVRTSDKIDRRYMLHWLSSSDALSQVSKSKVTGVISNLSLGQIGALQIPLPPLEEQRRIAGILDAADALRRRRREALSLLDTLPGAIFAEMFGDPTSNPRKLPTLPLGEFAVLERGKSKHRPRNDPQLLGGPHPLVQTGDVANAEGYIVRASSSYSDFGLKQSRKWPAGTLCITIAANIADGAILTFPACFPDSVVGCTVRESHHAEFIRVWLMSVKGRIEKVAPAVAQKNINLKILGAVPIIVPPEQEIQKFTAIMQQLRQDRERAARQLNELETLFASLQSRAFAGEL